MKNQYTEYKITTSNAEEQNKLIALLDQAGFEGFVEEEHFLLGYILTSTLDKKTKIIEHILSGFDFSDTPIENKNWNEEWEKNIQPVFINDFLCVRASFHQLQNKTQHEIIITPKMSFGTGHHETTLSVLELMCKINFKNTHVLDYGAGTGILAIFAEKLGATSVLAVDNDENCILNMQENIMANNSSNITIKQSEKIPNQKFNIVLCNVHLNFLIENISEFSNNIIQNGFLIISGFYNSDAEKIKKTFLDVTTNFNLKATVNKQMWQAMLFQKTN